MMGRQGAGKDGKPVSDQWIEPFVIVDEGDQPIGRIEDSDAVVIFNFRADRVVEISKAFEYKTFTAFDRKRWPKASLPLATVSVALLSVPFSEHLILAEGEGTWRKRAFTNLWRTIPTLCISLHLS